MIIKNNTDTISHPSDWRKLKGMKHSVGQATTREALSYSPGGMQTCTTTLRGTWQCLHKLYMQSLLTHSPTSRNMLYTRLTTKQHIATVSFLQHYLQNIVAKHWGNRNT